MEAVQPVLEAVQPVLEAVQPVLELCLVEAVQPFGSVPGAFARGGAAKETPLQRMKKGGYPAHEN